MKHVDEFPKSIKKTIRYINQDIQCMEQLEQLEKTIEKYIMRRKEQLAKKSLVSGS